MEFGCADSASRAGGVFVRIVIALPYRASALFGGILEIDRTAPFTSDNDVEISVAVEVHHGDAQARADALSE